LTRSRPLLLAAPLLAAALLAFVPTAAAEPTAFTCAHLGGGGGGLVGRTVDYVANVEYAVCAETTSYVVDVCVFLLGPNACNIA
jgi:hypothetical protein